ncbi:MAG: LLM class flavin-dependent oxidoreductase [Dehalococcoidia bacterium]
MVRVGISIVPFDTTYAEVRETALAAEEAGFESVWTWDHLISFNSESEPVLECWSLLAALAEVTSRVKLGSFVTNVMNRRPEVLAKIIATVQQVSGGRVELGIGAGERSKEQLAYSSSFPSGRERVERVGEAVELMRLLWSGESVDYQGQHYQVQGGRCSPPPTPIPFVMVAGLGPVSTRNAARVGDGWNCEGPRGWDSRGQKEKFFRLKEVVLEELERLGRPRESFEISISEKLNEGFLRDPLGYLAEAEKNGIDRVVLDIYQPFDLKALASVGKAVYG